MSGQAGRFAQGLPLGRRKGQAAQSLSGRHEHGVSSCGALAALRHE